jgi:hypothetical protein
MAYISNPIYCGVGIIDQADASASARSARFNDTFVLAFQALNNMPPAQVQQVRAYVSKLLATLPPAQQQAIITTGLMAAQKIDPRRAPGLGDALATTAAIAGIIASVTSIGIGVFNFVDSRKKSKAQQDAQAEQQSKTNALLDMQIAAQEQKNKDAQAASDAARKKQQAADAATYAQQQAKRQPQQQPAPGGEFVPGSSAAIPSDPTGAASAAPGGISAGTIAAILASGAGAFFLANK